MGFTASKQISGLTPNTLYTFNLSCTNSDPSSPYVTGWSYGSSNVPDPVGLVALTGPAPPNRPTLSPSNVVIGNTSIALRIGDHQGSRSAPDAYGNPIVQYALELEDLDAPNGSPPLSLASTTLNLGGVPDSHQTSECQEDIENSVDAVAKLVTALQQFFASAHVVPDCLLSLY